MLYGCFILGYSTYPVRGNGLVYGNIEKLYLIRVKSQQPYGNKSCSDIHMNGNLYLCFVCLPLTAWMGHYVL